MFKYTLALLLSLISISVFAQSNTNATTSNYVALTNQMKTQLNLTSVQVQQVQQIIQTREVKLDEAMNNRNSNKVETNNALNTIRSNYLNQLQGVLTQEQWNIYNNSQLNGNK